LARNRNTNDGSKYLENFILTEDKKPPPPPSYDDTNMVKQVIYMLVAVVVLFAICWAPLLIDNILTAYDIIPNMRCGFLKYMYTTFHLMAYFNRYTLSRSVYTLFMIVFKLHQPDHLRFHVQKLPRELQTCSLLLVGTAHAQRQQLQLETRFENGYRKRGPLPTDDGSEWKGITFSGQYLQFTHFIFASCKIDNYETESIY
jgi:hypothetical protein